MNTVPLRRGLLFALETHHRCGVSQRDPSIQMDGSARPSSGANNIMNRMRQNLCFLPGRSTMLRLEFSAPSEKTHSFYKKTHSFLPGLYTAFSSKNPRKSLISHFSHQLSKTHSRRNDSLGCCPHSPALRARLFSFCFGYRLGALSSDSFCENESNSKLVKGLR